MNRQVLSYAMVLFVVLLGCRSPKVLVPPRCDLGPYKTLGIVSFTSNSSGNLEEYATRKFMQSVQGAQSGVRILELGDETRVLDAIDRDELDFEAMRLIGKQWGVDAVFAGYLDVMDVRPRVDFTTIVKSMSLEADVEASLAGRLVETDSGATIWTRSVSGQAPVAHVRVASGGLVDFGASDPERAYGRLVGSLVRSVTTDFRAHWVRP